MVDEIIEGIVAQIRTAYPNHQIYVDHVEQGLEQPCFFVRCVNQSHIPRLYKRHREDFLFEVLYYPEEEIRAECETVAYSLYDFLEHIPFQSGMLRGEQRNSKVEEYVLHFFVSYSLFLVETSTEEHMEEVKYIGEIKEGSNS